MENMNEVTVEEIKIYIERNCNKSKIIRQLSIPSSRFAAWMRGEIEFIPKELSRLKSVLSMKGNFYWT